MPRVTPARPAVAFIQPNVVPHGTALRQLPPRCKAGTKPVIATTPDLAWPSLASISDAVATCPTPKVPAWH